MSNIPEAREKVQNAIQMLDSLSWDINLNLDYCTKPLKDALSLMTRKSPDFRAPKKLSPLSPDQVQMAIELRVKGWSQLDIANELGTNPGRVSEALNP